MTNVQNIRKELKKPQRVNSGIYTFKAQKERNYFKSKGQTQETRGGKKIEKAHGLLSAASVHLKIYQEQRESTVPQKLEDV